VAPILLDTNVLLYALDQNEPAKQTIAIEVMEALELGGHGMLSVQCLAEFATAATRRLRPPLTPETILRHLERFAHFYTVFDLTVPIVLEAARGVRDHRLSYYDAQLWATARLNQVPAIFTEDFTAGRTLEYVRYVNPFAEDFDLAQWA